MSASSVLRATFLVLLSSLLYTASCYVFDNQGNFVENGGAYRLYADALGGYLGFKVKDEDSSKPCPNRYVAFRKDKALPPPVKISQKSEQTVIDSFRTLNFDSGGDRACNRSGIWRVDGGDPVIQDVFVLSTGGSFRESTSSFRIEPYEDVPGHPYDNKLLFCYQDAIYAETKNICFYVGVFGDGLLGLNGNEPLLIQVVPAGTGRRITAGDIGGVSS